MYFVYILQSLKDKRFYIGQTNNIERRLERHNRGLTRSTTHRRPFVLVYFETFATRVEARKRERKIKMMKGGNEFKKLMIKSVHN